MSFKIKNITFHTVDDLPQGSDKWQLFRRGKITASNANKLLQKGKYAAILENKKEVFNNEYTDRGHALEFEVKERLNALLEKDGVVIKEFGALENDNYPNCAYSPDGVVFPLNLKTLSWAEWAEMPLIEVKCYSDITIDKDGNVRKPMKHTKCCKDLANVPVSAIVQMQFGMMIAERDICYLVLYNPECKNPDYKIKIWTVKRDEAIIKRLQNQLNK